MERDRGPRGDASAATSLWIDYLLLPEKLEEHLTSLASAAATSPSPAELITVFLEQALLSQKVSGAVTKTAALLCERAARVAVSVSLSLEDIESSITSPQHQFMLLKALVKHDKLQLLIHECDLNRWMLRNALQSHPLGSTAPNASLAGPPQPVVWSLGEEDEGGEEGCWSGRHQDESHAVEFLEKTLSHREGVCDKGEASACKLIGIITQETLSAGYWCRIMLDVAEVHFMRGRIHVAHELFTRCAELNQRIAGDGGSSVPMQRLAGFIVACRMLLGLHPKVNGSSEGSERDLNEIVLKSSSLLSLGEPSAAQKMVIACERSRYNLKQAPEEGVRSTPEHGSEPPLKKLKSSHNPDVDMETNEVDKVEDVAATTKIGEGSDVLGAKVVVGDGMSVATTSFREKVLESVGLSEVSGAGSERECILLVRNVVGDTLDGHLKKGYRLSLARDSGIPASLHCQLVACNIVRDVVEGAPLQSFLQSSGVFRDSLEGVKFLMSLMAAVKKGFDESPELSGNGSSAYISEFAVYVCCVLDRPWCWEAARKENLIGTEAIPKLFVSEHFAIGSEVSTDGPAGAASLVESSSGNLSELEVVLCALLTAEDIRDIERLVERLSQMKDGSDHVNVDRDVAAVLRRRAFNALDNTKQLWVAKKLYELAKRMHPRDHDSMMMLWLLDKVSMREGAASMSLPGVEDMDKETSLDLGALEYVLLNLIEKELWKDLTELCEWGLSVVKNGAREGSRKGKGGDIWQRRCVQILKVATTLEELMQLCTTLLQQTHYNEDVARISTKTSQLFEDLLCLLVGSDVEASSSEEGWGAQNRKAAPSPLNPSIRAVPLISQLTNTRVLTNLASLMAGWLQRCNIAGLIPWPLFIERYGALAAVTSGASLPPHGAAVFAPFPPSVSPDFGRNLFGVLLERIVELPGAIERDKDKGHRWLQGLADLAFEDDSYVKALQLYLQAGGIKSAFYCDRSSAMTEEVFTQWVLRRMVQACRAIGATIQAALLCQKLPGPDHESAFRILQENSLIVVRDAVAYFDCVWEVPLLELLVHMHAKSGDHERHSALISLLQQPALNAHNPQSVRVAHVASLEQRFLQRLCGELL